MNNEEMKKLKAEYAKSQRYGAHFICASLVIWLFIFAVGFSSLSQYYKNMLSLYSSALLVPLALLFCKILKIRFSEKDNPLNTAGLVFALNQLLYLIIVIMVWLIKPEQMLTAYAIVVGAHFLPYSWLYNSTVYRIVAIVIPVLSFVLALMKYTAVIPAVMIAADIVMIIIFLSKTRRQG